MTVYPPITAPQISVVIPTWNRCGVLATTLERLAHQTLPTSQFEVLVVDDGSTDATREVVASHTGRLPYSMRYFHHPNHGPGYTQNRGIREARAERILILADDIWATPRLLERHLQVHDAEPGNNIAVLGQVLQSPELPPTVMHRHWDPFGFFQLKGRRELTALHFWGCNISFHRAFLLEHGLFHERRGAANEDTELGYRLSLRGLRVLYEPSALGYHQHEINIEAACRRAYQEGRNFDVLDTVPKEILLPFIGIFTCGAGIPTTLRTFPKEIVRAALFHPWLVDRFWIPVLNLAEKFAPARVFASSRAYRGVFGCYYRKGIRDLRRAQQAADPKWGAA
jgi:glycosyltransferase involved in cell wall biosynthesis